MHKIFPFTNFYLWDKKLLGKRKTYVAYLQVIYNFG